METNPWARFALGLALLCSLAFAPAWAVAPLRIGLTPAFLHDRYSLLAEWKGYLEKKLQRPVSLVIRDSYQETMDLMRQGALDAAWLCDCPYVTQNPKFRLLATPVFQGRPYYRAYLIVPARDKTTHSIAALKHKVFAYTDPHSNVGFLIPKYDIVQLGDDPQDFFRRTFYTWSHRKAIEAVAEGVAQGAYVSAYIWESLHRLEPGLTERTRVASRSEEYGFPPFVAHFSMPEATFQALRKALLDMPRDPDGRALLQKTNLDGFTLPDSKLYLRMQEIVHTMAGRNAGL